MGNKDGRKLILFTITMSKTCFEVETSGLCNLLFNWMLAKLGEGFWLDWIQLLICCLGGWMVSCDVEELSCRTSGSLAKLVDGTGFSRFCCRIDESCSKLVFWTGDELSLLDIFLLEALVDISLSGMSVDFFGFGIRELIFESFVRIVPFHWSQSNLHL